jgi:hypothetical protein
MTLEISELIGLFAIAFVMGCAVALAFLPKTPRMPPFRDHYRSPLWHHSEVRTYSASVNDEDLTEEEAKELFEGLEDKADGLFEEANTLFRRARSIHRKKREQRRRS